MTIEEKNPTRAETVLVADDDAINRLVICRHLEKSGIVADTASDGLEAIEMWRDNAYDLILMDRQMPGFDGLETTRHIRREEGAERRTVIIALTGNVFRDDREECFTAGMDDFLAKPFREEELVAMITRWLPAGQCDGRGDNLGEPAAPSDPKRAQGDQVTMDDRRGSSNSSPDDLVAGGATSPTPTEEHGAPTDAPALDPAFVEQIHSLGERSGCHLMAQIAEIFLGQDTLTKLQDAALAKDFIALETGAHTLKGSSGNAGAIRLSELCHEVERAIGSGDWERSLAGVESLAKEYKKVEQELRSYLP